MLGRSTILLAFTGYKPNCHDLSKLGRRVASMEPQFLIVFPQASQEERARFELLRQAYIRARYYPSFRISASDLGWLAQRVTELEALTERFCQRRIASYSLGLGRL